MGHIHKLGLENFRIFKSKEVLDFAPITILTGTNNSGKSTAIKCLQLLKASAAATGGLDRLLFTDGNHNLGTYQNARNNELDSNQITITLGLWLASANLDAELELIYWSQGKNGENGILAGFRILQKGKAIVEAIDRPIIASENPESPPPHGFFVKVDLERLASQIRKEAVPKLQGNDVKGSRIHDEAFKARLKKSMELANSPEFLKAEAEAMIHGNSAFSSFHIHRKEKIEIEVKEASELNKPILEPLSENDNLDHWNLTNLQNGMEIVNEDDEYYQPWEQSRSVLGQFIENLSSFLDLYREDSTHSLEGVSALENYLFHNVLSMNIPTALEKNAASIAKLHHLSSVRASAERLYSNSSNSSIFNAILLEYLQAAIIVGSHESKFLSKYLQEFKIGDSLMIKRIEGVASAVYLVQGEKEILLADLGFGYTQLLPIMLRIAIIAKQNADHTADGWPTTYSPSVFLLEEPEGNLHPSYQSKIADMIIDAAEKFNIQFIIETHSEYLIRKLQYHTATGKLKPQDTAIYYFEAPDSKPKKKKRVRKITIQKDGRLSAAFGEGFFDETPRLMLSIMNLSDEN